MTLALGVLASGNGSNLQAILEAIQNKHLDAVVKVVLSDQPTAKALQRARDFQIPHFCILRKDYPDPKSFESVLLQILRQHQVDWVVLAGFMRVLSPFFVQAYSQRIVNIHPSLLPAFPGLHGIQQALDYGVKVTGCTVHLVDEGCDTGPILGQQVVEVESTDTLESLSQKIHVQEHQLYPEILQKLSQQQLHVEGRKVFFF